jgi:hypothetical protein
MASPAPTHVQVSAINATKGHIFSEYEQPIGETIFEDNATASALYRHGLQEYGRCKGKVYVGEGTHVGYVFESRRPYEDSSAETYLQETWLSFVHIEPATLAHVAL